jgi:hypothetical protein
MIQSFEVIGKDDKGHDVMEVEFKSGITLEFTSKELDATCKEYKTYLLNQKQKKFRDLNPLKKNYTANKGNKMNQYDARLEMNDGDEMILYNVNHFDINDNVIKGEDCNGWIQYINVRYVVSIVLIESKE